MHRFNFNIVLMLPILATSLLVTACFADATSPKPTPHYSTRGDVIPILNPAAPEIYLVYNLFVPDQRISTSAELTHFLPGERINVTLTASDGAQARLGTATADDSGTASVDIRHDPLSEGTYEVMAIGNGGGKANATLFVSSSRLPLAGVELARNNFSADLPISTTAVLSGFLDGEQITVSLMAEDGSEVHVGTATAKEGGLASVDIRHDGLPPAMYAVFATGDHGSKAHTALFVK